MKRILFLPILMMSIIVFIGIIALFNKCTALIGAYEGWLQTKLNKDPEYIDWLKCTDNIKGYKLGKRILNNKREKVK